MTPHAGPFSDKVVLVTGGSTGIGRATSMAFAEQGAKVVIGDWSPGASETASDIEASGGRATFIQTDVSEPESVEAMVDAAMKIYGRLDAAFNNAGILPRTALLADMTIEDFDRTIDVDLKGVFLCMKYEIAAMLKGGGGAIVNNASVAGVIADPGMAPYVAAKHGVVGLTKAAALDYARQNIRVNAVAPGLVETPMTAGWLSDPAVMAKLMDNSPIGRPARPEEIAGTVLHLCSDAGSFITGQTFIIDGGQTAH